MKQATTQTKSTVFSKPKRSNINASSMTKTTTRLGVGAAIPSVYYTPTAWFTIQHLVDIAPKEVGWLGIVEPLDSGDYLITDIHIPEQTVTAAETDIDSDAMMDLYNELLADDVDTSKLYYWGHSHVNMGVSPSLQDEIQIEEYLESCPIFIRGIYNKKGASKVDIFDKNLNVVHQCVDNTIMIPDALCEKIDKTFEEKVNEYVYTPPKNGMYSYNYQYGNQVRNTANGLGTGFNAKPRTQAPAVVGGQHNTPGFNHSHPDDFFHDEYNLQELDDLPDLGTLDDDIITP